MPDETERDEPKSEKDEAAAGNGDGTRESEPGAEPAAKEPVSAEPAAAAADGADADPEPRKQSAEASEATEEAREAGDVLGAHPHASTTGKAWGLPFVKLDERWTKFETWLCAVVLLLEVAALTLWVALKGLSTPPDGAKAGIVFRALFGATLFGMAGYWALRKQSPFVRRAAAVGGLVLGLLVAKSWSRVGVDWSSNLLNWYQQSSTLTLLGGLRGVGTRLTLLLALLGGSLATGAGRHITIDLLTRFLKPKLRLPVTVFGWLAAAIICFGASWGFFDHIAIENFGDKADSSAGQKIGTVFKGLGKHWFILRKQVGLDLKSLPHVLKGDTYTEWMTGTEWNAWLDDAGFVERFGKEKVEALRIPEDSKHTPMVLIPDEGEPRGALTHAANLVFPIGLLIIGLRFILLSLLALSGHKSIEGEGHMDLGTRPHDEDANKETA
jgi:hypothetical protein